MKNKIESNVGLYDIITDGDGFLAMASSISEYGDASSWPKALSKAHQFIYGATGIVVSSAVMLPSTVIGLGLVTFSCSLFVNYYEQKKRLQIAKEKYAQLTLFEKKYPGSSSQQVVDIATVELVRTYLDQSGGARDSRKKLCCLLAEIFDLDVNAAGFASAAREALNEIELKMTLISRFNYDYNDFTTDESAKVILSIHKENKGGVTDPFVGDLLFSTINNAKGKMASAEKRAHYFQETFYQRLHFRASKAFSRVRDFLIDHSYLVRMGMDALSSMAGGISLVLGISICLGYPITLGITIGATLSGILQASLFGYKSYRLENTLQQKNELIDAKLHRYQLLDKISLRQDKIQCHRFLKFDNKDVLANNVSSDTVAMPAIQTRHAIYRLMSLVSALLGGAVTGLGVAAGLSAFVGFSATLPVLLLSSAAWAAYACTVTALKFYAAEAKELELAHHSDVRVLQLRSQFQHMDKQTIDANLGLDKATLLLNLMVTYAKFLNSPSGKIDMQYKSSLNQSKLPKQSKVLALMSAVTGISYEPELAGKFNSQMLAWLIYHKPQGVTDQAIESLMNNFHHKLTQEKSISQSTDFKQQASSRMDVYISLFREIVAGANAVTTGLWLVIMCATVVSAVGISHAVFFALFAGASIATFGTYIGRKSCEYLGHQEATARQTMEDKLDLLLYADKLQSKISREPVAMSGAVLENDLQAGVGCTLVSTSASKQKPADALTPAAGLNTEENNGSQVHTVCTKKPADTMTPDAVRILARSGGLIGSLDNKLESVGRPTGELMMFI